MERILIIEDDSAIQRALKRLFESEGYYVDVARDGTAGLELFYLLPTSHLSFLAGNQTWLTRYFSSKSEPMIT
jgi:CheY-like chemotaxis protein